MAEDASALLAVANRFYAGAPGEFIVLACDRARLRGEVTLGLYPIVTLQYSSTTLSQVSYHIR